MMDDMSCPDYDADRDAATDWARALLARPAGEWCLLDLETTGRHPESCGVVQIAVLAPDGDMLMQTRVNPEQPMPAEATRIHGLMDADVRDAPIFAEVYEDLAAALAGRVVIIYNAGYDWQIITRLCAERGVATPAVGGVECAMLVYAQWWGEWNDYFGSYKWHRLPAAPGVREHDALGDCASTLALIKRMAQARKSSERIAAEVSTEVEA